MTRERQIELMNECFDDATEFNDGLPDVSFPADDRLKVAIAFFEYRSKAEMPHDPQKTYDFAEPTGDIATLTRKDGRIVEKE